jgi:hypothetical protein
VAKPASHAMHVDRITSHQGQHVSYLLRQSFREGDKVKHRTLANLTPLPAAAIDAIRAILKGLPVGELGEDFEIERSLPHGHVLAVLGMVRQLQLDKLLAARPRRDRELVVALIVRQVIDPSSKLATARSWESSTLGSLLGVGDADEDELYPALDWLRSCQPQLETQLARRHLMEGSLVLYDLTSVVMGGRHCKLAKLGYSRDGKRGTLQVKLGLVADQEGRPVAVEVFPGNTSDPAMVASHVEKLRQRFGVGWVLLVGGRGMLTSAPIEPLKEVSGIDWVSALKRAQIQALVERGELQLGLFAEPNLVELISPSFPGERLVVCKNQDLAGKRARKREVWLQAAERDLGQIAEAVAAGRLSGEDRIGVRVGRVINRFKVGEHFEWEVAQGSLVFHRRQGAIAKEAALDGIYVIRASLGADQASPADLVRSYQRLAQVERAFRSLKSIDLRLRPIRHRLDDRVKAHIFLCMLAYHVRWHLERAWAPLLCRDEQPPEVEGPVAKAQRSATAVQKGQRHQLGDDTPTRDFAGLLDELASLTRQVIRMRGAATTFHKLTTATPLQQRAFSLLGLPITL